MNTDCKVFCKGKHAHLRIHAPDMVQSVDYGQYGSCSQAPARTQRDADDKPTLTGSVSGSGCGGGGGRGGARAASGNTHPLGRHSTSCKNSSNTSNNSTKIIGPSLRMQKSDSSEAKLELDGCYGNSKQQKSEVDALQAWLTLACIFVINATTLGSLKIYGLIFEEIVAEQYYTRGQASWPISTASTVQNLAGLLTPILVLKISWRSVEFIQTALFVAANVGAYFSRTLALDIFCLGIVQGVAFSLRYNMNVVINNEYFARYRATAMGISLAGSTCGVFALKPLISYVLDTSDHHFRNAYLTLAAIMSLNLILNLFIRKPRIPSAAAHQTRSETPISVDSRTPLHGETHTQTRVSSLSTNLTNLLRNPNLHCIWIMQTIYFYISRTYTIFLVDYGIDTGMSRADSRNLLDFWIYGEIGGRLLLGSFVDSRILSLRWNIVLVNLALSLSGFALLVKPSMLGSVDVASNSTLPSVNATIALSNDGILIDQASSAVGPLYFWLFGAAVALVAALSSLVNMMIVPFGQEYVGKHNVPWAFAMGSFVTSIFLLFRPSIIGLSRDYYKSYDLLIIVMSTGPFVYSILFAILEPLLRKYAPNENANTGVS